MPRFFHAMLSLLSIPGKLLLRFLIFVISKIRPSSRLPGILRNIMENTAGSFVASVFMVVTGIGSTAVVLDQIQQSVVDIESDIADLKEILEPSGLSEEQLREIYALLRKEFTTPEEAFEELKRVVTIAAPLIDASKYGETSSSYIAELLKKLSSMSIEEGKRLVNSEIVALHEQTRQAQIQAEEAKRKLVGALQVGIDQDIRARDIDGVTSKEVSLIEVSSDDGQASFDEILEASVKYFSRGEQGGAQIDLLICSRLAELSLNLASDGNELLNANRKIADCLSILGERGREDKLREAIEYYEKGFRAAEGLEPTQGWAAGKLNYGIALRRLGNRISDPGSAEQYFEKSILNIHQSLDYFVEIKNSLSEAIVAYNLGSTYSLVADRDDIYTEEQQLDFLETSVPILLDALSVFEQDERFAFYTSNCLMSLGNAYQRMAKRGGQADFLQSIQFYDRANDLVERNDSSYLWAQIQLNLGTVKYNVGKNGKPDMLDDAEENLERSLEVFTVETSVTDRILALGNLGQVYEAMAEATSPPDMEFYLKAQESYDRAEALLEKDENGTYHDWIMDTKNELQKKVDSLDLQL